ncbi:MAG: PEP-CTERM sorting domain-containing protein [Hydrococcus sp. Prado102]|jgi:hypothetical protein|nr:PEP-CTERM sorting domain-containing protein [Hydrococcus sp. Prado102]
MAEPKHLYTLAIAAITLVLCFNPASTQALSLRILGSPSITNDGRGDSCPQDNIICFGKPQNSSPFPTLSIGGRLVAEQFSNVNIRGNLVDANVLNLTGFSVRNGGGRFISSNFITFNNTFPSFTGNVYAYQFLQGDFNSRGRNQVNLAGTVNGQSIGTPLTSKELPGNSPFDFDRRGGRTFIGTGTRPTLTGNVSTLVLEPNNTLVLGRSSLNRSSLQLSSLERNLFVRENAETSSGTGACIVLANQNITEDDAKDFCDRVASTSVPEPSSVISLLALGVFGGGFLLKRRRKSSSEQ